MGGANRQVHPPSQASMIKSFVLGLWFNSYHFPMLVLQPELCQGYGCMTVWSWQEPIAYSQAPVMHCEMIHGRKHTSTQPGKCIPDIPCRTQDLAHAQSYVQHSCSHSLLGFETECEIIRLHTMIRNIVWVPVHFHST